MIVLFGAFHVQNNGIMRTAKLTTDTIAEIDENHLTASIVDVVVRAKILLLHLVGKIFSEP